MAFLKILRTPSTTVLTKNIDLLNANFRPMNMPMVKKYAVNEGSA